MGPIKTDGRRSNKPPTRSQFRPGSSGNPRGRPKHTSTDLDDIIGRESAAIVIANSNGGKKIRLTKVEAIAHQAVNAALNGNNKAVGYVLNLARKLKDVGVFEETITVVIRRFSDCDRKNNKDAVGYGKPPRESQFKKGVSGNPGGRPVRANDFVTALANVLRERIPIRENGKKRTVFKLGAIVIQLMNRAAGGDLQASKILLRYNLRNGSPALVRTSPKVKVIQERWQDEG